MFRKDIQLNMATEKAITLIRQALNLLSLVPQPGKIEPTPHLQCLLNQWIVQHCTQWKHYSEVHDPEAADEVMVNTFFDASQHGQYDVCRWLSRAHRYRVFKYEGRFRLSDDYDPLAVCMALQACGCTLRDDTPTMYYALDSLRWATENDCLEYLQFVKYWGMSIDDVTLCGVYPFQLAARHGHVRILEFFQAWDPNFKNFCNFKRVLLEAAEHNQLAVLKFLKGLCPYKADDVKSGISLAVRNNHREAYSFLVIWLLELY